MWVCKCVHLWKCKCGCVSVWMCESLSVWMCGCVSVWMGMRKRGSVIKYVGGYGVGVCMCTINCVYVSACVYDYMCGCARMTVYRKVSEGY